MSRPGQLIEAPSKRLEKVCSQHGQRDHNQASPLKHLIATHPQQVSRSLSVGVHGARLFVPLHVVLAGHLVAISAGCFHTREVVFCSGGWMVSPHVSVQVSILGSALGADVTPLRLGVGFVVPAVGEESDQLLC